MHMDVWMCAWRAAGACALPPYLVKPTVAQPQTTNLAQHPPTAASPPPPALHPPAEALRGWLDYTDRKRRLALALSKAARRARVLRSASALGAWQEWAAEERRLRRAAAQVRGGGGGRGALGNPACFPGGTTGVRGPQLHATLCANAAVTHTCTVRAWACEHALHMQSRIAHHDAACVPTK